MDSVAMELKQLYDQYGLCAGRFADLLDYLDSRHTPQPSPSPKEKAQ